MEQQPGKATAERRSLIDQIIFLQYGSIAMAWAFLVFRRRPQFLIIKIFTLNLRFHRGGLEPGTYPIR